MSSLMGKIADRAKIMQSLGSELDTAVIKATKHNTKMPKEKHVRSKCLIQSLCEIPYRSA